MLDGPPPTPDSPDVPPWLAKAIRRGLSPRPSQRWPTMNALLAALAVPTDRPPRRPLARFVFIAVGVASGLGAGLWVARRDEAPDPCAAAREAITPLWNDAERARVASAFAATGVPYAGTMAATVSAELDQYADAWASAAETACRTEPARASCLELPRAELGELVELYASADPTTVERALDAATALTPISWCTSERGARFGSDDLPVHDLRQDLARAKTLSRLGKAQDARALARDVADAAARLGLPALQAEALLELGDVGTDALAAQRSLEDAFWLALGAGDDELAARAAIALLRRTRDIESATVWRRHAQVLLARRPPNVELPSALAIALGTAATNRGENDLAIEYHTTALRALERERGPMDLVVLSAAFGLARAFNQASLHVDANAQLQRVLAVVRARLGENHPQAALVHTSIGANDLYRHSFESAERELRLALGIYAQNPSDDPVPQSIARRTLGEVLIFSGRIDAGRAELQAALAALPQPPSGTPAVDTLLAIGTAHLLEHQPARSLPLFRRAMELDERRFGADNAFAATTLSRLSQAFEALGDLESAISSTHRAAIILARTGDPVATALQFANLGVLERARGEHADAIAFCRRSIHLYETSATRNDPRLAFPLRLMALSFIDLDRPQQAIAPLERALLLYRPDTYDAVERPKTMLALARALWEGEGDRARAHRLATEAKAELVASGRQDSAELEEVSDWLHRHP
ncbi:MAG TPA: tetratricopeptide repeat protein, partial [Nannocystaceae bacterium]|nr:tetratricopeptide repeat protein [Nannocystaceae bacterium]